jgi:hypothetical protein
MSNFPRTLVAPKYDHGDEVTPPPSWAFPTEGVHMVWLVGWLRSVWIGWLDWMVVLDGLGFLDD